MAKIQCSLRLANVHDLAFAEVLHRRNMGAYLEARGIPWDSNRFLASWAAYENFLIVAGEVSVGLLRLSPEGDALGLRDIQVVPEHQGQGIGSWGVQQAQAIAAGRGIRRLQLRVYEENPARALYARLGFEVQSVVGGTVHMAFDLLPETFCQVPSPHDAVRSRQESP